jgi:hypothetical protein
MFKFETKRQAWRVWFGSVGTPSRSECCVIHQIKSGPFLSPVVLREEQVLTQSLHTQQQKHGTERTNIFNLF